MGRGGFFCERRRFRLLLLMLRLLNGAADERILLIQEDSQGQIMALSFRSNAFKLFPLCLEEEGAKPAAGCYKTTRCTSRVSLGQNFDRHVTHFAPHKVPKVFARGKLIFEVAKPAASGDISRDLAIDAKKLAPRTRKWLQDRGWDKPAGSGDISRDLGPDSSLG